MLSVLSNLSNIIIPLVIFYIVAEGMLMKTNVYENFIKGAKDGFQVVIGIMPTLIGLMVSVGVFAGLRFSGLCGKTDRRVDGICRVSFFSHSGDSH